jgi:hypothetical protein
MYQTPPGKRLGAFNYVAALSNCVDVSDCGEEFSMKEFDLRKQNLTPLSSSTYNLKVSSFLSIFFIERQKVNGLSHFSRSTPIPICHRIYRKMTQFLFVGQGTPNLKLKVSSSASK